MVFFLQCDVVGLGNPSQQVTRECDANDWSNGRGVVRGASDTEARISNGTIDNNEDIFSVVVVNNVGIAASPPWSL